MNPKVPQPDAACRGRLFVVSAASGTGKTTLCQALRQRFPELRYSVSYTTRAPREGEVAGRDYHFVTKEDFTAGIAAGKWAEWAEVHGNYYGTAADVLETTLAAGACLLLEIDVQGAKQIMERFPEAETVFILPPSLEELERRLAGRGTDTPEVIARRMAAAENEIRQKSFYRHHLVNDDLARATADFIALVGGCLEEGNRGETPD